MTHHDAFLQSIIEAPDDDTPRCVYADWLMEQPGKADQARGEFIVVQLELAFDERIDTSNWPADLRAQYGARTDAFSRRELELYWSLHPGIWGALRELPVYSPADDPWRAFRRGFVEHVTSTAEDFIAHADALRAATPLRKVTLTTEPELRRCLTSRGPFDGQIITAFAGRIPADAIHSHSIPFSVADFAEAWQREFPGLAYEFELPPAFGHSRLEEMARAHDMIGAMDRARAAYGLHGLPNLTPGDLL